jgi:two-component system, chemotaxis family, sensor kinase CheA
MNALHEQFVTEARELIQQGVDDLIAMEREGAAPERIDRVFRAFHTLKGSAGVVALPAMALSLHAAEDVLAAIHAGRLACTPPIIDLALLCLDQVARWVDDFAARETLPPDADETARLIAERLRSSLSPGALRQQDAGRDTRNGAAGEPLPQWVAELARSQRVAIAAAARGSSKGIVAITYEPHAGCFFNGDDPLALMRQIPQLLALAFAASEPWPALAELDPFACRLRLRALSAADRSEVSGLFRFVPDQVRIIEVPWQSLPSDPAGHGLDPHGLVHAILVEQRRLLGARCRGDEFVGRLGSAARVIVNVLRHDGAGELAQRIEPARAESEARGSAAPLLSVVDGLLSRRRDAPAAEATARRNPREPESGAAAPPQGRSLRVDVAKLDALVNLAGELIVAKNRLAHLARRVEEELGDSELGRAVRREHAAIESLAGDMHGVIVQLKMVPVAQVFRRLPRLVRDMSRDLGKEVQLLVHGETTETDKTVVDLLFEPLLHLVRNALDHGIETPKQRRAAGKADAATLTIGASRSGDRFLVDVSDDGSGIDPAVVRRKARASGVVTEEVLHGLSDEQVIDLIFSAGFSTATAISDVSGRGVGMDVVRTTVERLGGRVSVTTRIGAGTTVRLDMPVNIAVSRIMVVEAGGQSLGIPMDAVTETVRLAPDRIRRIRTNDGFVLRDRVVPICPLADLMGLPGPALPTARQTRLVVVTEAGGALTALEVDAVRDRLEVVLKPMHGLLANARQYAGTTLLGDGRILLVLDLKEILA